MTDKNSIGNEVNQDEIAGATVESRMTGVLTLAAIVGGIFAAKKILFSGDSDNSENPVIPKKKWKIKIMNAIDNEKYHLGKY